MAEPFIGQVDLKGFNFAQEHWAFCQGQTLQIINNQALFSLLGTAYGGDGRSTFGLPDLRGKIVVSQGIRPGTQRDWKMGNTAGNEFHRMTESQLPSHYHMASFSGTSGTVSVEVYATTENGDSAKPLVGAFLAQAKSPQGGSDRPELIYKGNASGDAKVNLGGVATSPSSFGGAVSLLGNGSNTSFSIEQSTSILNYSIALLGLFPSRN